MDFLAPKNACMYHCVPSIPALQSLKVFERKLCWFFAWLRSSHEIWCLVDTCIKAGCNILSLGSFMCCIPCHRKSWSVSYQFLSWGACDSNKTRRLGDQPQTLADRHRESDPNHSQKVPAVCQPTQRNGLFVKLRWIEIRSASDFTCRGVMATLRYPNALFAKQKHLS